MTPGSQVSDSSIEIATAGLEDTFVELSAAADEVVADELVGGAPMGALAHTRFELLRTLRNVRLLVFSLRFPLKAALR